MKPLLFLALLIAPMPVLAETIREQIKATIEDAIGPPGNPIEDKTQIVAVNADNDVTFIFMCSAGKEEGAGDLAIDAIFTVIATATGGIPLLFQQPVKRLIAKGVVNKGDAYCSAIASKTGTTKKARNVSNASIFTTAWNGATKGETESDESACEKIQNRYLCFKVVEAPFKGGDEVDGVSGCFEAEIDTKLVSYSFGRGTLVPDTVKNTFSATGSKSDQSCEKLD
jgi:hypothetical protein